MSESVSPPPLYMSPYVKMSALKYFMVKNVIRFNLKTHISLGSMLLDSLDLSMHAEPLEIFIKFAGAALARTHSQNQIIS